MTTLLPVLGRERQGLSHHTLNTEVFKQFLLCGLDRLTYLCLKGDTYTDLNTAFAADELRATHLPVLCSVPLSSVVYQKAGNFAAPVFIPICAGAAPAWRLS